MDVEIEIALRQGTRPTGFDRLNTMWWILALLRLSSGAPVKLPVVSDVSFSTIADGPIEPSLWPIETLELMDDPAFGRAFQTFDAAIWAHTAGSALVTIWAALETLIQPGKQQITKRLASSLAALLEPPGPKRNRLFGRAKSLYEARGGSAHASRSPEAQQLLSSFEIGRQSFMSCIDRRALPKAAELQEMWRQEK